MRKKVIHSDKINRRPRSKGEWLDLEEIATVEVTSEDPHFPIEFALAAGGGPGWRAAEEGERSSASFLIPRERCIGFNSSFRRQKSGEPRSSHCGGLLR